jgi:hypothetical protein
MRQTKQQLASMFLYFTSTLFSHVDCVAQWLERLVYTEKVARSIRAVVINFSFF